MLFLLSDYGFLYSQYISSHAINLVQHDICLLTAFLELFLSVFVAHEASLGFDFFVFCKHCFLQ